MNSVQTSHVTCKNGGGGEGGEGTPLLLLGVRGGGRGRGGEGGFIPQMHPPFVCHIWRLFLRIFQIGGILNM